MKSKFKYLPINNQLLFKITHFNKIIINTGTASILPFLNIIDNKGVNLWIHNGKKNIRLKASNLKLLAHENFFFIRKLKVGNFRFTKKHCIFKKKLRKKK